MSIYKYKWMFKKKRGKTEYRIQESGDSRGESFGFAQGRLRSSWLKQEFCKSSTLTFDMGEGCSKFSTGHKSEWPRSIQIALLRFDDLGFLAWAFELDLYDGFGCHAVGTECFGVVCGQQGG